MHLKNIFWFPVVCWFPKHMHSWFVMAWVMPKQHLKFICWASAQWTQQCPLSSKDILLLKKALPSGAHDMSVVMHHLKKQTATNVCFGVVYIMDMLRQVDLIRKHFTSNIAPCCQAHMVTVAIPFPADCVIPTGTFKQ